MQTPYPPPAALLTAPVPSYPSIGSGDLAPPGLPRDSYGRAALVTVIAIAADLLAPWVAVDGTHRAVASIGAPALVALPILGAALLPLISPVLRKNPVYAAIPLIVGCLCIGAGGAMWMVLTYLSYRLSIMIRFLPISGPVSAVGPDVGVYLFILGGAVLVFTGYHIFLGAAANSAPHAVIPSLSAHTTAATALALPATPLPATQPALPPYLQAQRAEIGQAVMPPAPPHDIAAWHTPAFAPVNEPGGQQGVSQLPYATVALPPAGSDPTSTPSTPYGNGHEQGDSVPATQNGGARVPLPGSAEWNEAPPQPGYVRPSLGGWHRGPRVHR